MVESFWIQKSMGGQWRRREQVELKLGRRRMTRWDRSPMIEVVTTTEVDVDVTVEAFEESSREHVRDVVHGRC